MVRTTITRTRLLRTGLGVAAGPLAGSLLASCGGTAAREGSGSVTVTGPAKVELGHYFAQGPRWDLIQAAARRFQEQYPNLTVEVQPITGNYWETMIARLAGG